MAQRWEPRLLSALLVPRVLTAVVERPCVPTAHPARIHRQAALGVYPAPTANTVRLLQVHATRVLDYPQIGLRA